MELMPDKGRHRKYLIIKFIGSNQRILQSWMQKLLIGTQEGGISMEK